MSYVKSILLLFVSFATSANALNVPIDYTCQDKPFAHPYFRAKPGYDVDCSVLANSERREGKAPNQLWAVWIIVNELCKDQIEVKGREATCDYVPVK